MTRNPSGRCCCCRSRSHQPAMASVVQCLLRNCFEYSEDDDDESEHDHNQNGVVGRTPALLAMARSTSSGGGAGQRQRGGGYLAPTAGLMDPHDESNEGEDGDEEVGGGRGATTEVGSTAGTASASAGGGGRCGGGRRPSPSEDEEGEASEDPPPNSRHRPSASSEGPDGGVGVGSGVRGLFRRLGGFAAASSSSGTYGRVGGVSPAHSREEEDEEEIQLSQHHRRTGSAPDSPVHHRRSQLLGPIPGGGPRASDNSRSPLRAASSFTGTEDSSPSTHRDIIPAISVDQVVLPGSELQKQMSAAMMAAANVADLGDPGDECVICLEGFDPTNPRMPTLCGCGENKTYFHLPCLYQWIEQDRNCPSCRQRLRWEEF